MNAIQHAMKEAGMRLPPLNKRIWLWLKDHPGKTYDEIAAALGEKPANVSGNLSDMTKRKMVTFTKTASLHTAATGRHPTVSQFTVVGQTFELLPRPFKAKTPASSAPPKPAEPVVSLVPRKVGRPYKDEDTQDLKRVAVVLQDDALALVDKGIADLESSTCIALSRTQFIIMCLKRHAKGA